MSTDIARNDKGQFVTGVSGNPKGRPKGAKSVIVQQKLALEAAVREGVSPEKVADILNKLYEAAMDGDVTAAKYILDKFMSNAKIEEDDDKADKGVQIVIKNATFGALNGEDNAKPIDGEATVITDEES